MTTRRLLALAVAALTLGWLSTTVVAGTDEDMAALANPHGQTRAAAADRLADAAGGSPTVLAAVTNLAMDENAGVRARIEAIRVLGRVGQESSVRPLAQVVNNSRNNDAVRAAAVFALAHFENSNAYNAISAAAAGGNRLLKAAGIDAAAAGGVVQALPSLVLAIKARESEPELAAHAMRAAGAIIARRSPPEAATAELRALLVTIAEAPEGTPILLWQSAALALGSFRHPGAVGPLLRVITDDAWTLEAATAIAEAKEARRNQDGDGDGGNGNGGDEDGDGLQDGADDATPDDPTADADADADDDSGDGDEIPDTEEEKAMRELAGRRDAAMAPEAARRLAGYGAGIYPDVYTALLLDTDSSLAENCFAIYCQRGGPAIRPRLLASLATLAEQSREAERRRNEGDGDGDGGSTAEDSARARARARARAVLQNTLRAILMEEPEAILAFRGDAPRGDDTPVIGLQPEAAIELAVVLESVQTPQAIEVMLPIVDERQPDRITPALAELRANVEVRRAVMNLFAAISVVERPNQPGGHGYMRELRVEDIVPPAIAHVDDADDATRSAAIEVLENRVRASEYQDEALEAVTARLPEESSQALLGRLARLLVRLAGSDAARPVIDLLGRVQESGPRAQLLEALTSLSPQPVYALQILQATRDDLFESDDLFLRQQAVRVTAWLATPQAVDRLNQLLADMTAPRELRRTILQEVPRLKSAARGMIDTLVGADNNGGVLAAYRDVLTSIPPEEETKLETAKTDLKLVIDAVAATGDERAVEALAPYITLHAAGIDIHALTVLRDLVAPRPDAAADLLPALLEALKQGHPLAEQQDPYRAAVLETMNVLTYDRGPWRPRVGRVLRDLELVTSGYKKLAKAAVVLTGKIRFAPLVRDLTAAWSNWATDEEMRTQIRDVATQLRPNWEPPADEEPADDEPAGTD